MAIPDFQTLLLPVLDLLSDGKLLPVKQVALMMSDRLKLSDEEKTARIPSGYHTVIYNRTAWAITYLRQARLIDTPKRGVITINDEGRKVLAQKLPGIDMKFLEQYPAYKEFKNRVGTKVKSDEESVNDVAQTDKTQSQTPEESIDQSYQVLRGALVDEILDAIGNCKPEFFERLVVELLVAMGYGGSIEDAGRSVGKSGDGGIDGVIKEDRLGLDKIHIQAKRYDESQSIGGPAIRDFLGAMDIAKANKGVFITTSTFSKQAIETVGKTQKTIVLIDGKQLANYMIDCNVGVSPYGKPYTLKRLDSDYYELDNESA